VGNDFGLSPGPKRDDQIALVKRWVDHSQALGARAIRVFAGHAPKEGTEAEAHTRMVAGLEECCDYAGQHGIYLALENHGGPTATPEGLLKIVREVKSPWMAVNLDTGNFHGKDVYAEMEAAAPYAVNVQVKVVVSQAGSGKQPTDYGRIAKILTASGYRGYIVLEFEEAGDPRTECPKHLAQMREAFSAAK
jgi:sugar phosphate isomerase/epimerase